MALRLNGSVVVVALLALACWRRSATAPAMSIVEIPPCEPMRANVLLREYPNDAG